MKRDEMRLLRHERIRKKIHGTAARPRMSVFRSSKNIGVQLIDDTKGTTLMSVSTLEKSLKDKHSAACEGAKKIGEIAGQRAVAKGITNVVFDRGGYLFHGRVKALADGARSKGLKF